MSQKIKKGEIVGSKKVAEAQFCACRHDGNFHLAQALELERKQPKEAVMMLPGVWTNFWAIHMHLRNAKREKS